MKKRLIVILSISLLSSFYLTACNTKTSNDANNSPSVISAESTYDNMIIGEHSETELTKEQQDKLDELHRYALDHNLYGTLAYQEALIKGTVTSDMKKLTLDDAKDIINHLELNDITKYKMVMPSQRDAVYQQLSSAFAAIQPIPDYIDGEGDSYKYYWIDADNWEDVTQGIVLRYEGAEVYLDTYDHTNLTNRETLFSLFDIEKISQRITVDEARELINIIKNDYQLKLENITAKEMQTAEYRHKAAEEINQAIQNIQFEPDLTENKDGAIYTHYWTDADTIDKRTQEIVVCEGDNCTVYIDQYDNNNELVHHEVIFDLYETVDEIKQQG